MECRECPAPVCDRDEEGYCGVCKMRALQAQFPPEFRYWVSNLEQLYLWREAGYIIPNDLLDFEQWQALALITRHYKVKDLESTLPHVV